MNTPIIGKKQKPKAQILITLDDSDRVAVSTSSKNPVTNMGLLAIAQRMLQVGIQTVSKTSAEEPKDSPNGNQTKERIST